MRPALAMLAAWCAAGCVSTGMAIPARLTALGTEPFWNLAIDGGAVAWSQPEQPAPIRGTATRGSLPGGIVLTGTLGGDPLRVEITAGPCSDGMSDRTYRYRALVVLGERRMQGCAFVPGSLTDRP